MNVKPHSTVLAAKVYEKRKTAAAGEPLQSPRVVMRTKELADVNAIKKKLEQKAFPDTSGKDRLVFMHFLSFFKQFEFEL